MFFFFFASPQPPICACVHKYPDERLPLWLACGKGERRVDKERFSTRVGDTLPPLPTTSSSFPSPRHLTLSSFSAPVPLLPLPACIWYPRQAGAAGGLKIPLPTTHNPCCSGRTILWMLPMCPPRRPWEPGLRVGTQPPWLPSMGVLHRSAATRLP